MLIYHSSNVISISQYQKNSITLQLFFDGAPLAVLTVSPICTSCVLVILMVAVFTSFSTKELGYQLKGLSAPERLRIA